MSILADFFVSTQEAAASYDPDSRPVSDVARLGGLIPIHLELLWAILQGREWDTDLMAEFEDLEESESGTSWLVRLPDDLVARLAQASANELIDARFEWAATEELSCDPSELIEVVESLRRLSENAMATNRSVFLKGSL